MLPSETDFETKVTLESESGSALKEEVFRILFLGDWSGSFDRSDSDNFSHVNPIVIDRDNFDEVLQKLNVKLELKFDDSEINILTLNFTELDDFHPDKLFQKISLFSELRELRQNLLNSQTFETAARVVRTWFISITDSQIVEDEDVSNNTLNKPDDGNLLDQILSNKRENLPSGIKQSTLTPELNSFIRQIVQPHIVKTDETEQLNLVAAVDEATSNLMRKILHHPHFQNLESAWRGLYFLVKRVETDVDLKLYILDISKKNLADNLKSVNDLANSAIYKKLVDETLENFNGEFWSVICGNYDFALNVDDAAALIRFGKISTVLNAPFISNLNPSVFGFNPIDAESVTNKWNLAVESVEYKLWDALRISPGASFIGLMIPRFLIRLPYGNLTEPTETFNFEEFAGNDFPKPFVWGNPSFICALLLAQSFRDFGWEMGNSLHTKVEGLPVYFFQDSEDTKTNPCTDIVLNEDAVYKALENGLMPLITFLNSDIVQLARFQSIAKPLNRLQGKWQQD